MKTIILILAVFLVSCDKVVVEENIFIDQRDGKEYGVIEIGKQTWMDRNMEYKPYNNENFIQSDKYGVFYTWFVANDVCPDGWHLPTDKEWEELFNHVGIDGLRYGEFKALYGGWYQLEYANESKIAAWWSSTEYNSYAWVYYLKFTDSGMKTNLPKTSNICVRCIMD